jgi:surface protein
MKNSNSTSINKLISLLPTRTSALISSLDVTGVDDISLVDESTLNTKYWILINVTDNLIAKYVSKTEGSRPTFNSDYSYTVTKERLVNDAYYEVELSADTDFTSVSFNGNTALLTVDYLKITNEVTTMANLFTGCTSLTRVNASNLDTSNVTNMSYTFRNCPKLVTVDVSNFNTENVTDMGHMFSECRTVTFLDVSNFNTENVTIMRNMFYACSELTQLDVSNFDTGNVIHMNSIFFNCSKLTTIDMSNWDTSNVTNFDSLFRNCTKLTQLDVSNWDTSNVTNMAYTFAACSSLTHIDLSNFNTAKVTRLDSMLSGCKNLVEVDVSNFDTIKVGNMNSMFSDCTNLVKVDMSNWNISNIKNKSSVFDRCSKLQHVGMIYCDLDTVNAIVNLLPTVSGLTRTIYIQDTKSDICTPRDSIVFYDYTDSRTIINIPQQLNDGDMLLWDDSLASYIIKKSDNSVSEIGINVKYVLDVVGPYYRIETNEKESAPASMNVKLYISKDVL